LPHRPIVAVMRSHHFSAILTASETLCTWQQADFLAVMKTAVSLAQLTPVGELAVTFHPQGVSAVLLLEESHLALHFWPENQKVSIDIHVCDYHYENQEKAKLLAEILTLKMSHNHQKEQWNYLLTTD
jgi:S-adenosylmethionine decarboxylase